MQLFKRNARKSSRTLDKPASRIAVALLKAQRRWAEYMNRVTAHWSPFQKKLALALFCITMSANSGIALYKAFQHRPEKSVAGFRSGKVEELNLQKDTLWRQAARINALYLGRTLDSINAVDSSWLPRLKRQRPGLWDSISAILEYK